MQVIWWVILIVAGGILVYTLLRSRVTGGLLLRFTANLALAMAIVYIVKATGILPEVEIEPNIPNALLAGMLGLPGVGLLYALHLLIFI